MDWPIPGACCRSPKKVPVALPAILLTGRPRCERTQREALSRFQLLKSAPLLCFDVTVGRIDDLERRQTPEKNETETGY